MKHAGTAGYIALLLCASAAWCADDLLIKADAKILVASAPADDLDYKVVMNSARQLRAFFALDASPKRASSNQERSIWLELWRPKAAGFLLMVNDEGIKLYAGSTSELSKGLKYLKRISKLTDKGFEIPKGNYGTLSMKKLKGLR